MSNVLRRLKKLEAQLTDRSTYAPHSAAWFLHWLERCGEFLTTGDGAAIEGMPLAFLDEVVERGARGEHPNEGAGQEEGD